MGHETGIRRRVALGAISMGYGKLVGACVQLALVSVLARSWGVALYGQWILLATIPTFLAASDFGFGTAAGTRMIGEVAAGDRDDALVTFQSAWAMILTCSAGIYIIVLAASFLLPSAIFNSHSGMTVTEARLVLAVLSLYGIIALQGSIFMAVARSERHFALSTSLEATVQLVEASAALGVVLLGGTPLMAATAYLTIRTIGIISHATLARHVAPWLSLGFARGSRHRVNALVRPAFAAMLLPLSQAGFLQGTALAVGAAAGIASVPLFTSLRTLSRIGLQAMNVVNLALMPEFTAAYAKGAVVRTARIFKFTIAVGLLLSALFALAIGLLGQWFVLRWTGGAVEPPQMMVTITAVAIVASGLWNPVANLLLAINRHATFTYVYLAGAVASILVTFMLVRAIGVSGAAIANLFLDVTMLIVVMASASRNLDVARPEFGRVGRVLSFLRVPR